VLPAKDFIRYRLTGQLVTDAGDAAATLLFNPRTRSWSKQLLGLLGFQAEWLPTIGNGPAISGRVTDAAARESGLQAGTPVAVGASHAAALAITAGAITAGTVLVELGNEGALFSPTAESLRDPAGRLHATCHTLPTLWALAATDCCSGTGLDWIMEQVMPSEVAQARRNQREPLDLLAEMAAEVPPGADGLLYLPSGGRNGPGGFIGLEQRHSRGHLVRAVLEGGAMACRRTLRQLGELRKPPEQVLASGPGAGNHLWCQILADALDRPVVAVAAPEPAAYGAAILAAAAVGIFKQVDDACARMTKNRASFQPRRAASDAYAALTPLTDRLPDAIASACAPPQSMEAQV
jgi:xylulokinase